MRLRIQRSFSFALAGIGMTQCLLQLADLDVPAPTSIRWNCLQRAVQVINEVISNKMACFS